MSATDAAARLTRAAVIPPDDRMVRRIISFLFAAALLLGGAFGTIFLLFFAARIPLGLLAGAAFFATIGAAWLWADFIAPLWRDADSDA
jgi:hypothetical protein